MQTIMKPSTLALVIANDIAAQLIIERDKVYIQLLRAMVDNNITLVLKS